MTKHHQHLPLIPTPYKAETFSRGLRLNEATTIAPEPGLESQARYLQQILKSITGYPFNIKLINQDTFAANTLRLVSADNLFSLGDEAYELDVTPEFAALRALKPAGIFYGIQSLRQLLQTSDTDDPPGAWFIPSVKIEDQPRFRWRGLHLDVARHIFPLEFIKKYIDLMALHKMNIFHWHLTDDQGWRIEIKQYPKLTAVGSRREATPIPSDRHTPDGKPYQGYYTQEYVAEIVAYASERYVTVIPEIEMPGHALAALASYPDLGCTGGPYDVGTSWGVFEDVFCAGNEQVYHFLEDVLGEVIDLFPGEYIHIGGDECPKARLMACPKCQARIKERGLADEGELQSHFIKRIAAFLASKGRRLIGWDEILEGGLASDATVMVWRDAKYGAEAARMEHNVIMSPTAHCYFDYYQSEDLEHEPPAIGGCLPLEQVYAFEPIPQGLLDEQAKFILGGQGNLWTEYISTPDSVKYMTFPRATALAEVLWSPKELRDYKDFRVRLPGFLEHLRREDVNYQES